MKSLHIRNVPTGTLAALKRLADSHHRSLQGELLVILERAARLAPPEEEPKLQLHFVHTGHSEAMTRGEIYEDYR